MSDVTNPTYRRVSALAVDQGGFVRRDQIDLPYSGIESWRRRGRLIRVFRNVYAVGYVPKEPERRAWAATLATGGALCGGSAGAFYGVLREWEEPFEVVTAKRCRVANIDITHCASLRTRDRWLHEGLPVTSPARTALELAPTLKPKALHSGVDHLRLRHKLKIRELEDVIARNPGHPGAGPLRALIGLLPATPQRSDLEREFAPFAERFGLPRCEYNATVAGYEVDVLVGDKVIVELDTFGTHLLNFASDRERDADILARTGIPTIRLTDQQFRDDPEVCAERIRAAAR